MTFIVLLTFLYVGSSYSFVKREVKTLFIENRNLTTKNWQISTEETHNVRHIIDQLSRSPYGKRVLKQAQRKAALYGETLHDVIKMGPSSLTDTTLIRKFSARNPSNVAYEQKSKVYINQDLTTLEAVLDLAHELTHYIYRIPFNPYKSNFTLGGFIRSTVEGKGGEVDAFMTECKVLTELNVERARKKYDCSEIVDLTTGEISRTLAIKRFYQIGKHYNLFHRELLDKSLYKISEVISESQPLFISAAYGVPYPIAAFKEYQLVMKKACANDQKRLDYFKNNLARSPASRSGKKGYDNFIRSYNTRCGLNLN